MCFQRTTDVPSTQVIISFNVAWNCHLVMVEDFLKQQAAAAKRQLMKYNKAYDQSSSPYPTKEDSLAWNNIKRTIPFWERFTSECRHISSFESISCSFRFHLFMQCFDIHLKFRVLLIPFDIKEKVIHLVNFSVSARKCL